MGAGASTQGNAAYTPPTAATGNKQKRSGAKHRRENLYEVASTEKDAKVEDMLKSDTSASSTEMNEATKQILLDAIGGFFFLDSDDGESQTHIDLFMKALERECCVKDDFVMKMEISYTSWRVVNWMSPSMEILFELCRVVLYLVNWLCSTMLLAVQPSNALQIACFGVLIVVCLKPFSALRDQLWSCSAASGSPCVLILRNSDL